MVNRREKKDGRIDADTKLDRWVGRRPIMTFLVMALLAGAIFVAMYGVAASYLSGGDRIKDHLTNYVGYLVTTVVSLAGALVSIMLARLALKLGREAKDAAERGNEIQDQMRKFDDPRLAETREGHKVAAALDLLGTLLCVYASEAFAAPSSSRPIEAIANTYKRGNDLVSDPAFYRYCTQLLGPATTADRLAALQSKLYEAAKALRQGVDADRDGVVTASYAEQVAIEIAKLARTVESAKQQVLADPFHPLYQLAIDLDWKNPENSISGCESTARSKFNAATAGAVEVSSLAEIFGKSPKVLMFVLEIGLEELLEDLRSMNGVMVHDSLRDFALACAGHADIEDASTHVVVARWTSSLLDTPSRIESELRPRPDVDALVPSAPIESMGLWNKAIHLSKNPLLDKALTEAIKDEKFIRSLNIEGVSEYLELHQGIDLSTADEQELDREWHLACKTAKRLHYIHAAIQWLKERHKGRNCVTVPDYDPYGPLTDPAMERVIIIRPYFASISMHLPGSRDERQDQWFQDHVGSYEKVRWVGSA